MEPLEELRIWLNTLPADYNKGVALMQSYSNKPATCLSLQKLRDPQKLRNHILQLFEQHKAATTEVSPLGEGRGRNSVKNGGGVKEAISKTITKPNYPVDGKNLLKELDALKSKLFHTARNTDGTPRPLSDEEKKRRHTIAGEIMELDNEFKQLVNPDKEETAQPEQVQPATGDNYKAQENCRKNVSRLKRKIENAESDRLKATDEKKIKKLSKALDTWQSELAKAEKKLNELRGKQSS